MCVVGILLSSSLWGQAYGALLLFITNLLGIMVGAMAALGTLEKGYRSRLLHSRLGLTSVALTALLVIPLGSSFYRLLLQSRQEAKAQQLEVAIEQQLRSSTITLGSDPAIDLVGLSIDWNKNPPVIRARVRVTDPALPTSRQVADVQAFINRSQAPLRFRLVVQRTAVDLIGPETAPNPSGQSMAAAALVFLPRQPAAGCDPGHQDPDAPRALGIIGSQSPLPGVGGFRGVLDGIPAQWGDDGLQGE
jgi:uncharacterized membrane protein